MTEFIDTPQQFVEELSYRAYVYNRQHTPEITPERWGRLFPHWEGLEARYQREHVPMVEVV